nr:hypothetical protein L203_01683 [Cryptococcus depauperatus CBS 7841]
MSLSDWVGSLRSQRYSPLPISTAINPGLHQSSSIRRRKILQCSTVTILVLLIIGSVLSQSSLRISLTSVDQAPLDTQLPTLKLNELEDDVKSSHGQDMWGWTEDMGWRQSPDKNLKNLGITAEQAYHLNVEAGENGMVERVFSVSLYFRRLYDFAVTFPSRLHSPFLSSIYAHLPPKHGHILPDYPTQQKSLQEMVSYKYIHMTDKTFDPNNYLIQAWVDMNEKEGWKLNFLDDAQATEWVTRNFKNSDIEWAWKFMHRGVLRADLLRYLLPLVQGGVYSDVDTRPIRPIEQWGHVNVEFLDISSTDGETWASSLSAEPSVIVGIEVDIHVNLEWERYWPRPFAISPNHPIFIDAVRRVVNATVVVQEWEQWRDKEVVRLETEKPKDWEIEAAKLKEQERSDVMNVMEWTGPGLFTDSVMAFLLVRYNVTWHRLRGLDHPLRIGDVLILPVTAFSPGVLHDFQAEGPDSPQANVFHNFRGSWKSEGL